MELLEIGDEYLEKVWKDQQANVIIHFIGTIAKKAKRIPLLLFYIIIN